MLLGDASGSLPLSPLGLDAATLSCAWYPRGTETATARDLDAGKVVLTELAGCCSVIARMACDVTGNKQLLAAKIADASELLNNHRELLQRVAWTVIPGSEPAQCSVVTMQTWAEAIIQLAFVLTEGIPQTPEFSLLLRRRPALEIPMVALRIANEVDTAKSKLQVERPTMANAHEPVPPAADGGQPPSRGAKRTGRRKADFDTEQREAKLAAEWEPPRDAGEYKPQFAKTKGMKVDALDKLLDRVAKRRRRSE